MQEETKQPQPNNQPNIPVQPNVSDIVKKGSEIYESKKSELEPMHNGRYVVIEVDSRKFFIGDTRADAVAEARKEFPDTVMFSKRIGGTEKVSRHLHGFQQKYARVL